MVLRIKSTKNYFESVDVSGVGTDLSDYFARAISTYSDINENLSTVSGAIGDGDFKYTFSGTVNFSLDDLAPPEECTLDMAR